MARNTVRDLSFLPPSYDSEDLRTENFANSSEFLSCLPAQYWLIFNKIIKNGMSAVYLGATYIFVPNLLRWVYSRSIEGTKYIASCLEMDLVSVNFGLAVAPFLTFIDQRSPTLPPLTYPSACISCWRLGFVVKQNEEVTEDTPGEHYIEAWIMLRVASSIVGDIGFDGRASSFSLCPIESGLIPMMITWKKTDTIEGFLRNVFSEVDLRALMWNLGNALVDPVNDPRIIYLYGAGGEGKTTTIGIIYDVLRGAVGSFSRDYLGGQSQMTEEDKLAAMSNRLMVFGDAQIKDSKINEPFWKLVTGKDVITVQGTTGSMRTVCIFAGNNLWYGNSSKHHKWFVRRTFVYKLGSPSPNSQPPPESFSDVERMNFISRCLYLRLTRKSPIVSLPSVFLTIFGYRVAVATRGIEFKADATELECLSGTQSVVIASMIKYEKLIELVRSVSSSLVGSISEEVSYIRGIRPRFHGLS